jgi:hypothetical protein
MPVEGGWCWREGVQVFHLLVSFLVFASIVVPWLPVHRGLPATLQMSAKAFVDTHTHYHHPLLYALPQPYSPKECEGLRRHPTHGVPNGTNFNMQLGAGANINLKLLMTRQMQWYHLDDIN